MSICPLSADWGNIADWFGGIAALGVGIAVYFLSRAANATNRRIADLNEAALRESAGLQDQERTLLLTSLFQASAESGAYTRGLLREIDEMGDDLDKRFSEAVGYRARFAQRVRACGLAVDSHTRARLHVIGNPLSVRIARAMSLPSGTATFLSFGDQLTLDEARRYRPLIVSALRNQVGDVEAIRLAAREAMRKAGLNISDPDNPNV